MSGHRKMRHRGGGAPMADLWPKQHHAIHPSEMERVTYGAGMFEVNQGFEDVNKGADGFTVTEINPTAGAINGQRPGVGINGETTFLLDPSIGKCWVPSETYFRISAQIFRNTSPLTNLVPYNYSNNTGDSVAFANFAYAALFQQVRLTLNGAEVESNLDPIRSTVVMSMAGATQNWLNTGASAEGYDTYANRSANCTSGLVVSWTFRMPLNYAEKTDIMRGVQARLIFTWNPGAEQAVIDSLDPKLIPSPGAQTWVAGVPYVANTTNGYIVQLTEFVMGAAIASPSHEITPKMGHKQKIDLCPTLITPQNIGVGATSGSFNIAIPPSTYKIVVFFQSTAHGSNSTEPIDEFDDAFTKSLRLSDQSGTIGPFPDYSTNFNVAAGAVGAWRPYYDWLAVNEQTDYEGGSMNYETWRDVRPMYAFRYILPKGSVKNNIQVTWSADTAWPGGNRGQLVMYVLAFHTARVAMEWREDGSMLPILISRDS